MSEPLSNPPVITLDQLIALSEEIAALARAGMPLEPGLEALGRDMPGGVGRLAAVLAERSGRGQPLAALFGELGPQLPEACRAVVEAGLRAGRLGAAMESLSGMLRRMADLRRLLAVALVYPLIVLALAWGLFAFLTATLAPELLAMFQRVGAPGVALVEILVRCGHGAEFWGPLGPAALLLLAGLWWQATRRASLAGGRAAYLVGWVPWLGRSLRWSRAAAFTDILAVLLENRVPLDEALRLAGRSCGERGLAAAASEMAEGVRRGGASPPGRGLPPLLIWLISGASLPSPSGRGTRDDHASHGARPGGEGVLPPVSDSTLLPALRHAAEHYHRRARQQAELARVLLPASVSLGIGVVVMCFAVAVFLPYVTILKALGG
jgi:general secretion pathway protein F